MPQRSFPDLALADGRDLQACPLSVLKSTAVDALAHMVESFESKSAGDFSQSFALYGLSLWEKAKPVLLGEKEPGLEDYRILLRASTFAGMAIAHTGTSLPHALSYTLTYREHIAHGRACGVFLPSYLTFARKEDVEAILKAAGFGSLDEMEGFLRKILPQTSVTAAVMEEAITRVAAAKARMEGCRFDAPFTEESLRRLVAGSLVTMK